jgi:hypothetical protein
MVSQSINILKMASFSTNLDSQLNLNKNKYKNKKHLKSLNNFGLYYNRYNGLYDGNRNAGMRSHCLVGSVIL